MNPSLAVVLGAAVFWLLVAAGVFWWLSRAMPRDPAPPLPGQCPWCRERDGLHDATCLVRERGTRQ